MKAVGFDVPVAFLRLDDSTLHDLADTDEDTFAPPKGLVAGSARGARCCKPRRSARSARPTGRCWSRWTAAALSNPRRSTIWSAQVFRLAHANWRGFNAQSKPATLVYGEQLASLVGHLQDVEAWNPDLLRSELQHRPWFL